MAPASPSWQRTRHAGFTWNAGGWFGALTGCTCWMLLAGLLAVGVSTVAGAAALGCWVLACTWGVLLWRKRSRLSARAGIQCLLLGCGLAATGTLAALSAWGGQAARERIQSVSNASVAGAWWWLLTYPALMLAFAWAGSRRRG